MAQTEVFPAANAGESVIFGHAIYFHYCAFVEVEVDVDVEVWD